MKTLTEVSKSGLEINGNSVRYVTYRTRLLRNRNRFPGNRTRLTGNRTRFLWNRTRFSRNRNLWRGNRTLFTGNRTRFSGNRIRFIGNRTRFIGNRLRFLMNCRRYSGLWCNKKAATFPPAWIVHVCLTVLYKDKQPLFKLHRILLFQNSQIDLRRFLRKPWAHSDGLD